MDMLLVMNPQNSFLSPKGSVYLGERADVLKVRLADYLSTFPKTKVFLRERHSTEDTFFVGARTHSVATSEDCLVPAELKKFADFSYDKTRHTALFENQMDGFLRQRGVRSIGLVGVETHTGILFTAEDLRNRGLEVTVIEPLTMSRDDALHGFAITVMRHDLGVRISNG
jgi:nicotinamidase-related amidase